MTEYTLHEQVGHILRRANQRHKSIFKAQMPIQLPPTQFAALELLREQGELSQNLLGRLTAMDSATIAGVVSRLASRSWVVTSPSDHDSRMVSVRLSDAGSDLIASLIPHAVKITDSTLSVLSPAQRSQALELLALLAGTDE